MQFIMFMAPEFFRINSIKPMSMSALKLYLSSCISSSVISKRKSDKMSNLQYLVVCYVTFILAISIPFIEGQEELECRGVAVDLTVEQKAVIMNCLEQFGIISILKIPMEKIACIGVCVLEKKNLLMPDGTLDHQKILDYINKVMKPDEVKKILVDGTDKCIKDHGSNIKKDNDPTCQAFLETGMCVQQLFLDTCIVG